MAFKFHTGDIVKVNDGRNSFIGAIVIRYRAYPGAEQKYRVRGSLFQRGDYLESWLEPVDNIIVFRNLTQGRVYMTQDEGLAFLAEHPAWTMAKDGIYVANNVIDRHNEELHDELMGACRRMINVIKPHNEQLAFDANYEMNLADLDSLVATLSKLIDAADEICDPYVWLNENSLNQHEAECRGTYRMAHATLRRFTQASKESN